MCIWFVAVPRVQLLAIEIARNREGDNSGLRDRFGVAAKRRPQDGPKPANEEVLSDSQKTVIDTISNLSLSWRGWTVVKHRNHRLIDHVYIVYIASPVLIDTPATVLAAYTIMIDMYCIIMAWFHLYMFISNKYQIYLWIQMSLTQISCNFGILLLASLVEHIWDKHSSSTWVHWHKEFTGETLVSLSAKCLYKTSCETSAIILQPRSIVKLVNSGSVHVKQK